MYYLYAFRSRTNAISFYEALKREYIGASLINTPKAAGVGCGLSVKTNSFSEANKVLSRGYSNLVGVFIAENDGQMVRLTKI